jgi:hypothetical protein
MWLLTRWRNKLRANNASPAAKEAAPPPAKWRFVGSCVDPALGGGPFLINGINIWDCEWQQDESQFPEVRDPIYKQAHIFSVYTVTQGERSATFAAGEFSNCIWGFYTQGQK